MTPDGGSAGVKLGWTQGLGGIGVPSFGTVDKMRLPPFKLLPNPPRKSLTQIRKIGQQSCLIEVKDSSAVFRLLL
jgi:hypothetical protein